MAVVVNSFNSAKLNVFNDPGWHKNENTCSPGSANCGSPNWKVILVAADTDVVKVCVNVALMVVTEPNLLVLTALTEVLAGN